MATYFVATTGNDNVSQANNSINAPWKTLHLSCRKLSAGDTLIIRGGTYSLPSDGELVIDKSSVTVKAYENETVIIDGRAEWSETNGTVFGGRELSSNPVGTEEFQALVTVTAANVTVESITVINSAGEGVRSVAPKTTLRSIISNFAHSTGIRFFTGADGGYAKDCVSYKACVKGSGQGIGCRFCDEVIFEDCICSYCAGEGLTILVTDGSILKNCIAYDNRKVNIYASIATNCTIDGCLAYNTAEVEGGVGGEGIHVTAEVPFDNPPPNKTFNITIKNNLAVGNRTNLKIVGGRDTDMNGNLLENPFWGLDGLRVFNNSFIDSVGDGNILIGNRLVGNNSNNTPCWFVNNLIVQRDSQNIMDTTSVTDYSKWTASNNFWSKSPGTNSPFYNSGTDKIGDPGLAAGPIVLKTPADMNVNNYKIVQGSAAIDAGTTSYYAAAGVTVTTDYFGSSRDDGKPDMGAHEFQKVVTRADFSASPLKGPSPLQVAFQDKSVSSAPITSWLWDFGDGSVSNQQNPSHSYKAGTYTVSLRVSNSAGSNIVTKSNLITAETVSPDTPPRVAEGLQVLYRFDQRSGNTIYDVSGEGTPLDLVINNPAKVQWTNEGLRILQPTLIVSNGPAEKINEACRRSNEVTIEIWCTPANKTQEGPARIVSLSQNAHSRNLTLGQGLWGSQPSDLFDVRLRTTERSANGMPSFSSPAGTVKTQKTHIVFARKSNGLSRLHIDNVVVAETNIPGDFSTWNPRFPLLLGNETTGDYPWLGQVFLVAIYDRFLSKTELDRNYKAGTGGDTAQTPTTVLLSSFKRFVLVNESNGNIFRETSATAVAYGVQYPDERCVVCTSNGANSMTIYHDVNKVLSSYSQPGVKLEWLD